MIYGSVGVGVTELVITCKTRSSGRVDIAKHDAVMLVGEYTVDNKPVECESRIFGQALADSRANAEAIPVKVRGMFIFNYDGPAPVVNGIAGVLMSSRGKVKAPVFSNGQGINLKVDTTTKQVHVLL